MGYAQRDVYKKDNKGKFRFIRKEICHDVPMTYAGWKESQTHDKADGFKTRIKTKKSKSGLSLVPDKVIVDDKYGTREIYSNFRRYRNGKVDKKFWR